jgi:hypothetical protein
MAKKKKWKKRLKKLAKAAIIGGALYGGAKLLKNRGLKGNVEKTAAMEDANIGVTHNLPDTTGYITKKADVVSDAVPGSSFKPRVYPGTVLNERRKIPGHGTANYPGENVYNPRTHVGRGVFKGGGIAKRGTGVALKKGGRVTGIAKRGFGRALMKGKK